MEDTKESSGNKFIELDKMSPLVVYGILSSISLLTIYNTKNNFEKINTLISQNTLDIYIWYEVVFIIFGALMLLCFGQNGEKSLSCIMLFIPTILIAFKLIIIFIGVNNLSKKIPMDMSYGYGYQQAGAIPTIQDLSNKMLIKNQEQAKQSMPVNMSQELNQPLEKQQVNNRFGIADNEMMQPLGSIGSPF